VVVDVDEAWRSGETRRLDPPPRRRRGKVPELRDPPVADADVGRDGGPPLAIEDRRAGDHEIERRRRGLRPRAA
jgi:hypothetical protein